MAFKAVVVVVVLAVVEDVYAEGEYARARKFYRARALFVNTRARCMCLLSAEIHTESFHISLDRYPYQYW